jgi:hypothetical protein
VRQLLLADSYVAPPGGPTLLAADNFNRADAASLGTSSSGHVWNENGDSWNISSNKAQPPPLSGFRYVDLDCGSVDHDVQATLYPNSGSGIDMAIVARFAAYSDHILFNVTQVGGNWLCRAFEQANATGYGAVTPLGSPPSPLPTSGRNDPFKARVKVVGNQGEVFLTTQDDLNTWISMGTWTIRAELLSQTGAGLAASGSEACRFDDINIYSA